MELSYEAENDTLKFKQLPCNDPPSYWFLNQCVALYIPSQYKKHGVVF